MIKIITAGDEDYAKPRLWAALTAIAVGFGLFAGPPMFAQSGLSETTAGHAIGMRQLVHAVADLPTTVKFYREGLGMVPVTPTGLPITALAPPNPLSEALSNFSHTHGASFRNAFFNIPGSAMNLELTEFSGIPTKHSIPHMQDPGAATLILVVRDLEATLASVKKSGGTVASRGGQPLKIAWESSSGRSVLVRDPDGFLIELDQLDAPTPSTAPPGSNIIAARICVTIASTDQSTKFYRDVLGFDVKPGASFSTNKTIADLVDAPGAQWRVNRAKIPGSSVAWELIEFKDIARAPFNPAVPDPGSPIVTVVVQDVLAAVAAVQAGGGTVVTVGGRPVMLGNASRMVVRDPNGLLLVLMHPE